MPYLYILTSLKELKTYVGSTDRTLEVRLAEHNAGRSTFTRLYRPWKVLYFEYFFDLAEARLREKYFKTAAGRRKIKKIFIRE